MPKRAQTNSDDVDIVFPDNYPEDLRLLLEERFGELSRRAKMLIKHVVERGEVTTAEIAAWGYGHPPRAARDVRDAGIPLKTKMVRDQTTNRRQAAYYLDPSTPFRPAGRRRAPPPELKPILYEKQAGRCAICLTEYEPQFLQVDHRVPFAVGGERDPLVEEDYMLLCRSCNRSKSWTCEHCSNFNNMDTSVCKNCYWASPGSYTHIATRAERRLALVWLKDGVAEYERLRVLAEKDGSSLTDYIKFILRKYLK